MDFYPYEYIVWCNSPEEYHDRWSVATAEAKLAGYVPGGKGFGVAGSPPGSDGSTVSASTSEPGRAKLHDFMTHEEILRFRDFCEGIDDGEIGLIRQKNWASAAKALLHHRDPLEPRGSDIL